ncbi:MAG TPA: 2'-5' RNA ligase family protein [Candidatus Ozemobacteraceae bacterium]|nr:2'-5' RNA ligase family protein [Candidatus Ozemobacteraceae bacterium]
MTDGRGCKLPYTLAFRLPAESRKLIAIWHRRLNGICSKFDPLDVAHLTVKYLGYPGDGMTERDVRNLLPRIAEIAQPFLPMKVFVRGLDLFSYEASKSPLVYLKVLPSRDLAALHEAIRNGLGKAIDAFPHADGENFKPHITLSKQIAGEDLDRLLQLIHRSHKSAKRMFKLADLVVFTANDVYQVLPNLSLPKIDRRRY